MKTGALSKLSLAMIMGGLLVTGCSTTTQPSDDELLSMKAESGEQNVMAGRPAYVTEPVEAESDDSSAQQANNTGNTNTVTAVEMEPVLAVHEETVHFAFDSAELTQEAATKLIEIAKTAQAVAMDKTEIFIGGHTDAIGSDEYNRQLARERAKAVEDFLRIHMNSEEWEIKSYGESQPIATNDTADGREKNRRAVIQYTAAEDSVALNQ